MGVYKEADFASRDSTVLVTFRLPEACLIKRGQVSLLLEALVRTKNSTFETVGLRWAFMTGKSGQTDILGIFWFGYNTYINIISLLQGRFVTTVTLHV